MAIVTVFPVMLHFIQAYLICNINVHRISLQNPEDHAIVLSGCGTSGRLAFITAVSSI